MNTLALNTFANASADEAPLSEVVEQLRRMIASGRLAGGARLQELALADQLGVSRMRIRDALIALQHRGLVERQPNRSAVVVQLDLKGVFEILELRENLEGLCVRLATQNRPPKSWQYLVDLFEGPMHRYAKTHDVAAYLVEVEKFRNTVGEAAGNSILDEMLTLLRDRTRIVVDRTTMLPGRLEQGVKELTLVVKAMRRGDAEEAERLRRANIRSQREFVERYQKFVL